MREVGASGPLTRQEGERDGAPDRAALYAAHARPRLMELLRAIGLDVEYQHAVGDHLWYRDEASGGEVKVLDLLGGYGATLFGHNNPRIVARARQMLDDRRPFHAQASVRGLAGELAERLSRRVSEVTGRRYVATFANSGAEAVEAAVKHAEMEMALRIDAILGRLRRTMKEVRLRLREHTASVPESLYRRAARRLHVARIADLDELFTRIYRLDLDGFDREPCFLALEGAFHGKTTGALKLTHNPDYRSPWQRIGLRVSFLPLEDEAALRRACDEARIDYLDLVIGEGGDVDLVERELVNIPACFVEPIQGEGGVREVPPPFLRALRAAATAGSFPLVMDEIQSGMGRTGSFLASAASGVAADYYLLSKSLGGGLAKIAVLLVDSERYVTDYGYLHTSTFAEDDPSCGIALAALDELDGGGDGDGVLELCRTKGDRLLARLRELASRYPDVVADVRGRGLMIGLELSPQTRSAAPLVRVLSEQGLLGFVACGWLLHEARVRMAPTLSAHGTLRVEPSAYVAEADLDAFCVALERLLRIVRDGDSYRLARYLVGRTDEPDATAVAAVAPGFLAAGWRPPRHSRKVAFLGHFLEATDLRDWDPGLAPFDADDCRAFLDRTRGLLEPFIVDRHEVKSVRGDIVSVTVIGIPFTAAQVAESHRTGQSSWAADLVERGVELARRLGCSLAGLGGYTSIVTDNCRAIVDDEIAVTSGNSLTAAAALDALRLAARRVGITSARLGVLGAAGNIGLVMAEVAADHVGDIVLVGRPGAVRRLEHAAAEIYFGAWKRLVREEAMDALAGAIAATATVNELRRRGVQGLASIGETIRAGIAAELGEWAPVRVATDIGVLRRCNVIITATNSPRPVLLPEHIGEGPVVICDVAAPRDVHPDVLARPDVVVLKGGVVRAPMGQRIDVGGMALKDGQVYGCLAETILLGFASFGENFSYGRLSPNLVRRIHELARMHGFVIEEQPADRG